MGESPRTLVTTGVTQVLAGVLLVAIALLVIQSYFWRLTLLIAGGVSVAMGVRLLASQGRKRRDPEG